MTSKRLSENGDKQNTIKDTTWNVRTVAHKEEEMDSVLNEKLMKITENQKFKKRKIEINNFLTAQGKLNDGWQC